MALRLRRGTDAERQTVTPAEGELIYTTDTKELYIGDGTTQGGNLVSAELNDDTSPSLGGDLNLNSHNIIGTGNINITGTITATGDINLGDGVEDNVIVGGQIGSSLVPKDNGAYDLGSTGGNWRHVYAEGATIDGETTVGSLVTDGDIRATDSTVIYDGETGALSVTSINTGIIDGDLRGSVFADDSTPMFDANNKTGNFPGGITMSNVSLNHLGVLKSTDVGSDPQVLSDQPNTLIVRGITLGAYGGQMTTLSIDGHDGGLESPTNTTAGDYIGVQKFRGYYDGEYVVASTHTVAWDATADLTDTSPKANMLWFTNAGDGNGYLGAGYNIMQFRNDGVLEGPVFKVPSFADETARDAAIPSPEAGMIILLTGHDDSTGAPVYQGHDGTQWRDLMS